MAFAGLLLRYPECQKIAPFLRRLPPNKTLEAVLQTLQSEDGYPRKAHQIVEVRCYIHEIISQSTSAWLTYAQGVTNYKTLLYEIDRTNTKGEPVCLVTFDYDTLLEDALLHSGLRINQIADYTKGHPYYRVFKLHGSINWAREVGIQFNGNTDSTTPEGALRQLVQRADEITFTNNFLFNPSQQMGLVQGKPALPAIAVPTERKDLFECPQDMIDELIGFLPKVTRILVVGWRATEDHFVSLLHQHLHKGTRLYTVAQNQMEAGSINKRIQLPSQVLTTIADPDSSGFTNFIISNRARLILK
jgi:hypothetical protein